MKQTISLIALLSAFPAFAEESRELDAHEHGVGTLNIAIDGTQVAMIFEAPGADIVGFEYAAESDADNAAIDAAIAQLGAPLDLFVTTAAAGCVVVEAKASLEGEDDHEDHDDHDDDHDDHGDDHDEDHDEHDHDEGHDEDEDHDHGDEHDENHDDHAHDDHDDHDDHADEAGHTEFHAEYMLTCDAPDDLTEITLAYFDTFPNALEVEVIIVTESGAQAFEVSRDAPVLNLE